MHARTTTRVLWALLLAACGDDSSAVLPDAARPDAPLDGSVSADLDADVTPLDAEPLDAEPLDADLVDASAPDAGMLPSCTLVRSVEMPNTRVTPSLVSDGTSMFAVWRQYTQGMRVLDVSTPDAEPFSTGVSDGAMHSPLPFASWRGGLVVAGAWDGAITIVRVATDGTAIAEPVEIPIGNHCGGPIIARGDTHDLLVWSERTGSVCDVPRAVRITDTEIDETPFAFPVVVTRDAPVWDGTGWLLARADGDAITLDRVSADGTSIAATRTTTLALPTLDEVRVTHGAAGTLLAIRSGRTLSIAPVDDALAIGAPREVATSPLDVIHTSFAAAGDGAALVWTSSTTAPRRLTFLELDASGTPLSAPTTWTVPGLATGSSFLGTTLTIGNAIARDDEGWWLGWMRFLDIPIGASLAVAALVTCDE